MTEKMSRMHHGTKINVRTEEDGTITVIHPITKEEIRVAPGETKSFTFPTNADPGIFVSGLEDRFKFIMKLLSAALGLSIASAIWLIVLSAKLGRL
jgi:hypothetical protein